MRNENTMADNTRDSYLNKWFGGGAPGFLYFAGFRYWTASLLPAIVGTTLPFWLRPLGFSFKWFGAVEFLVATVLFHSGFSFLYERSEHRTTNKWTDSRLLVLGSGCILAACLLGLHLNRFAPGHIIIVYGLASIFAGMLYVSPPFRLCRQIGGEIVIAQSFGFMPVLGGYLVQTGDLIRLVYLASVPIVVATGLWVWTEKMVSRDYDETAGYDSLVISFGSRFSGRVIVPMLSAFLAVTLVLAVWSKSIMPYALATLFSFGLVWRIVTVAREGYSNESRMQLAHRSAFVVHLMICIVIAASSFFTFFR